MARQLFSTARLLNDDDAVRAVVLRGIGQAFCAGSDINALDDYGSSWRMRNTPEYPMAIWSIRKPVVVAVQGYAVGGGLELALAADIRIAAENAQFGAAEIRHGWHGSAGNTQLLPRLIGYGASLQLLLTGAFVDAGEAHRLGLVQAVVPATDLEDRVAALAEQISENAPIAVQLTKHLVRASLATTPETGLQYEKDLYAYTSDSRDAAEGRAAFREKRKPEFTGE